MRSLAGKVVVITGASSGIGRAAALEFASRGCHVVVAARRERDLEEVALACAQIGSPALVVPTDVTIAEDVERLAQRTLEQHGRIDVWVNNAGVTLFGALEEGPFEPHQRVIETNLFGAMHGARAALPIFRRQHSGVLVNMGSVLSEIGQPLVPSYVISKFALRGLSEALRAEVADEPDIHVCTLLPYAVSTPHFQDGANEVGRKAYPMPPAQTPEKVAHALVRLVARPRRELHVPSIAVLGLALHWAFPNTTEHLLLRAIDRFHVGPPGEAKTDGNLYVPSEKAGAIHGERSQRISTPGFAAWVAGEWVKMQATSARRLLRGARSGARAES